MIDISKQRPSKGSKHAPAGSRPLIDVGEFAKSSDVVAQYLETAKNDDDQEAATLGFRIRRLISAGFVGAFFGTLRNR